jgi:signal transduction histidine kinase
MREASERRFVENNARVGHRQAAENGIAVATLVEIPEPVSCLIWGDEGRLHQILGNLLGNSLKFTPSGGSVTVPLRKARTNAIIAVGKNPTHVSARSSDAGQILL